MTLENVRARFADSGTEHLLEALPPPESMTWIPHHSANPPMALVIGTFDGTEVLVFLVRYGEKAREVRYCTSEVANASKNVYTTPVAQDEVLDMPLIAPFKYLAHTAAPMKRKFNMLIRWYFLANGLIHDIERDNDEFSKRFQGALKTIKEKRLVDGLRCKTIEDSPDLDEPNVCGLRSASRNGAINTAGRIATEQQSPSTSTPERGSKEPNPDLRRLHQYLEGHDALYLLENIPDADEIKFVDQSIFPEAQPKKLFVGHHIESGDDIYGYMVRLNRGFHEIRFYREGARSREAIGAADIGRQRLVHPFGKTFPKPPAAIEQSDKARSTLMVKWYFIAAGIATNCVLKETKAYPERLRSALDYIARRMGAGAVKDPKHSSDENAAIQDNDSVEQEPSGDNPYVHESDIQSTLAGDPPRLSLPPTVLKKSGVARKSAPSFPARGTPSTQLPDERSSHRPSIIANDMVTATPGPTPTPTLAPTVPPHSAKRSADDMEFAELARMITEDQKLTTQINDVDHDLEVLEMRKETFMAKWQKEYDTKREKRDTLDEQRSGVRNKVKRQRMNPSGDD
ncbi:hypothetical protein BDW02DRAFT_501684 [Decorospora gaudefroyi]|uniref:Uncharacterized protein n=1 Tax=Decorospora gaudefroyi TaxID=184978 RepID=A0A6A5KD96_9PLEO|nr:hypothetical protein BDW02DRAFT_501684 [Decorospora gaudefroyi]